MASSWIATEQLPSEAKVRDATEADLPRLVQLLAQLPLTTPREDPGSPLAESYLRAFREIEADPRQRLLVVEVATQVTGSATLIIVPNLSHHGRPFAIVENIIVDASARSAGYGELLLRYVIEETQRAGCYKLSLTSYKRRTDAHRFYQRLGFQATHEGYRVEL